MEKIVILALVILSYVALSSAHSHFMTLHPAMSTQMTMASSSMSYASSSAAASTQMTMASASLGMEMKTIALSSAHSHSSPVHADKSRPSAMTTVMPGLHNFTIQMTMASKLKHKLFHRLNELFKSDL
ncbi:uncharacterized protein LOC111345063 isoform X1 [Stylophora pistillata]|uniref:uncharacterized protein LOC111345063 isoform X1 n=1 Tax=Stylophora pistillata TaxID=50429 RepID=UPI000C03CBFC|nr:uncharacterized protein LOC111345063 isoform X1 [Stylophora pistillata]XP_022808051.1 uncharacterized protein LOC111345063 isoform X2 [Stylophora pistillata]XP_022808052.1 uncharacterized protein LOC111345063 isoform X1 [Stylophora pistillata]